LYDIVAIAVHSFETLTVINAIMQLAVLFVILIHIYLPLSEFWLGFQTIQPLVFF